MKLAFLAAQSGIFFFGESRAAEKSLFWVSNPGWRTL